MKRGIWEYLTIPEKDRERLPSLGRDGWELVGIGGDPGQQLLYLKRSGRGFTERVTLEQRDRYYASLGRQVPDSTPDRA